jgi:ribulose 1,5-bisphosphate synthetase/thiazole synthase
VNVDKKLVIIGGGPAGHSAASAAARRGVSVTLIEREILGGAAHLLDCVPSKAMIATGGAMSFTDNLSGIVKVSRSFLAPLVSSPHTLCMLMRLTERPIFLKLMTFSFPLARVHASLIL